MPLIPRQQKEIDEGRAVRVVVLKGATIRGTTYFQEAELVASSDFAQWLVDNGHARWPD